MIFKYKPQGVCSQEFIADVENSKIKSLKIVGGCHGNTQGICKLLQGQTLDFAIKRLEGIDCRGRGTSCPDQLAKFFIEVSNKLK